MNACIFCFRFAPVTDPWCADNPGKGCTYGLGHEFPEAEVLVQTAKPIQPKRVDSALCPGCGLHPKNPKYATNGCMHGAPT